MQILTTTRAPRIDIIFDQYFSPSIKDYERALRNEGGNMEYIISGPEQVRPADFAKELRNIKFKEALVNFLIQHWARDEMVPFIGNSIINLNYKQCHSYTTDNVSVFSTINEYLSCECHEEADTKIVHHICKIEDDSNILIKSSDTDVLVIMLSNMDHLNNDALKIFMEVGVGNNKRYINVSQLYTELGLSICKSLPGFHALTGCDYNPSFFRRGKERPFQLLKKSDEYQKAFTSLGDAHTTSSRDQAFKVLEKFVCEIYNIKNVDDINLARFEKFCSTYKATNIEEPFQKKLKNFDASYLPPCKVELYQQMLRTQYITSIWRNAHLKFPSCLIPEGNGWVEVNGRYYFHWFDGDQFPQSVFDAVATHSLNIDENTSGILLLYLY